MALIEVCDQQLNEIMITDLKRSLEGLKQDLEEDRGGVWSFDVKEDRKIIKKHIKAFKLILDYYGYPQ